MLRVGRCIFIVSYYKFTIVVILFETTVLFDLHIAGENPCISVYTYILVVSYLLFLYCFVLDAFGETGGSKAIFVSVPLNILVIRFVSYPKYVNMNHLFCLWAFSFNVIDS